MMRTKLLMLIAVVVLAAGCTEVDNGYRGVAYKPYDGGLNPEHVYGEGVDMGFSWLWNDMITYDCRQKTTNIETTLLDKDGMDVGVTASVFHRVMPNKIGYLHLDKGEDYEETYIHPVFEGILKDVVGDVTALGLVTTARAKAQTEAKRLMVEAFAKNHIICDDVIIRDVDLPKEISTAITAKQTQDEKNLLAEKKEVEQKYLADAKVAKAKGDADSRIINAKAKAEAITIINRALSSSPQYVDLKLAEKWDGTFGTNNVFQKIPMIRMDGR